jgi:SpoVK/Ycf46/Vps4 family AAA+-type ATPase
LPDTLDKALFRRFDDVVSYPLPDKDQVIEIIKKSTRGFSFSKRIEYQRLADLAKGLNYSDIAKACNQTIKEMILSGDEKLDLAQLQAALVKRKA